MRRHNNIIIIFFLYSGSWTSQQPNSLLFSSGFNGKLYRKLFALRGYPLSTGWQSSQQLAAIFNPRYSSNDSPRLATEQHSHSPYWLAPISGTTTGSDQLWLGNNPRKQRSDKLSRLSGSDLLVTAFSLQLWQQSHQIEQRSNESPGGQSQDSDLLSAIFLQLSFPRNDFTQRGSFSDLLIARLNGLLNIQGFPGNHSQPQWAFTTGQSRSHNRPLGLFNSRPQRALLQANQALSIGQSGSSLRPGHSGSHRPQWTLLTANQAQ